MERVREKGRRKALRREIKREGAYKHPPEVVSIPVKANLKRNFLHHPDPHMGFRFATCEVAFFLVMGWVLHVLPGKGKPNYGRGRVVHWKYVPILRTMEITDD